MSNSKMYVGNLPFNVEEETLRDTFSSFGAIVSCKVITDRDTGRSKGFAFVEMDSAQAAQDAISGLDGTDMGGRNLKVNLAKPRETNFSGRW